MKSSVIIIDKYLVFNHNEILILDFSNAKRNKDGLLCITKFHPVENVVKEPILDCRHKMQKECHHTYVTGIVFVIK